MSVKLEVKIDDGVLGLKVIAADDTLDSEVQIAERMIGLYLSHANIGEVNVT